MPAEAWIAIGLFVLIAAAGLVGMVALLRIYDSPRGETLQRMRMQGPFVPLDSLPPQGDAEAVAGAARKRG